MIPVIQRIAGLEAAMMGRRSEQWSLFYQFRLDERVPKDHLLRRIDRFVTGALADIHDRLESYYSDIGRPSVDPELIPTRLFGLSPNVRREPSESISRA